MRRYGDPVEVRKGVVGEQEAPEQFLWHGRLWKVRDVLAHWVETGPWWQSTGARAVIGTDELAAVEAYDAGATSPSGLSDLGSADLLAERELWRVEAGRPDPSLPGGVPLTGVFELSFDWSDGNWQLVGCLD